jgi:hypothetical protein
VLLVVIIVRSLSSSLFLGACVYERQERNSETEKHIFLLQIEESAYLLLQMMTILSRLLCFEA